MLSLFEFKHRLPAVRFVVAIVISVAISPILTFLTYDLASVELTFLMLAAFATAFIAILMRSEQNVTANDIWRLQRIVIFAAVGWTIFCVLSLVDIQWNNKLFYNSVSYDFTTRVAIINAITRTGVPPINPSYFPGHPIRLTYLYYFWYIPCSLVDQLGGSWVDARSAMIASVAWCGLGLGSTIALYMRLRNPESGRKAWNAGLLGSGLLLVSGLDLIPVLFSLRTLIVFRGDLEHWNEQITAWVGSLLWVPHHVAALIACTAAVMLLHSVRGQQARKQLGAVVVAGLAFASGFGLSVFVTLVFVAFWGLWLIVLFVQKERRLSVLMALVGIIALITASPFLAGLFASGNSSGGGNGVPLAFAVRSFRPIIPFVSSYRPALLNLIFLLLLPINYLMELGFFFVAALIWIQQHDKGRWRQNPFHTSEIILLSVALFVGSFIRSTLIGSNDLGWRAWLPGQLVLLIWAVDVLKGSFRPVCSTPLPQRHQREDLPGNSKPCCCLDS